MISEHEKERKRAWAAANRERLLEKRRARMQSPEYREAYNAKNRAYRAKHFRSCPEVRLADNVRTRENSRMRRLSDPDWCKRVYREKAANAGWVAAKNAAFRQRYAEDADFRAAILSRRAEYGTTEHGKATKRKGRERQRRPCGFAGCTNLKATPGAVLCRDCADFARKVLGDAGYPSEPITDVLNRIVESDPCLKKRIKDQTSRQSLMKTALRNTFGQCEPMRFLKPTLPSGIRTGL